MLELLRERWEAAEKELVACVAQLPLEAEVWFQKCDAILGAKSGRNREALIDYSNALLLLDWTDDQRRAAREPNAKKRSPAKEGEGEEGTPAERAAAAAAALVGAGLPRGA